MNVFALADHVPTFPPEGEYWIAPGAVLVGQVEIQTNASIWYGSVLRGDVDRIVIGAGSNIQDCSVIHGEAGAPTLVGDSVTVGHMVMLHGCTIGQGSLIGIGAVVLTGAKIGRGCLIGARSLITEGQEIPDYSVVMGSPGRVVRSVTPEGAAQLQESADRYVRNWKRYVRDLRRVEP